MKRLNDVTEEEWDEAYRRDHARKKKEWSNNPGVSDGSTAKYYELPEHAE